jgi:hypothetical protein
MNYKTLSVLAMMSLGACSMFDKTPEVTVPTPVRNCVQQPLDEAIEKNPQIKCKRGDWQQIGDPVCSSTEAICLKKKF